MSVVCLNTTPQQDIFDSPKSKYKSKAMSIIYIMEAVVNTSQQNIRQAKQIEDSLSSSKNKVRYQNPKVNTSNLPLELSYPFIDEF